MQPTKLALFSQKIVVAGLWIILIIAPLLLNPYLTQLTTIAKATTLGSLMLIMVVAGTIMVSEQNYAQSFRQLVIQFLKQPLVLPTLLFLGSFILSTISSIMPMISFWGGYNRLDGTYFLILYALIFFLVRLTVHASEQLYLYVKIIVLTGFIVAVHGILQYFDLDPLLTLGLTEHIDNRISSMLGNPIFLGSYLVMVIPLTVMLWLREFFPTFRTTQQSDSRLFLQLGYGLVLLTQGVTLILTQSRGPLMGLLVALFVMGLLLLLQLPQLVNKTNGLWSKGWLVWLGTGMVGLTTITLLNLPLAQDVVAPVRDLPFIGRLSNLSLTEGSGQLRSLIWDGAIDLFKRDKPIGIPNDDISPADDLYPIRPLIGYGQESVKIVYPLIRSATLNHQSYVLEDEKNVDKLHNLFFDLLITNGIVGVITYYLLILAIIYYTLNFLGWIPNKIAMYQLWGLLIGGGFLGIMLAYLLDTAGTRFTFAPLGVTLGTIIGLLFFLIWQKIRIISPTSNIPPSEALLLIALFGSIITHVVDLQFSFEHSFTYLYFWIYLGFIVTIPTLKPANPTNSPSKLKTKQANKSRQPQLVTTTQGIIVAIIITTLIFNFMLVSDGYQLMIIGLGMLACGFGMSQLWIEHQQKEAKGPLFPIFRSFSGIAIGVSLLYGILHWNLVTWWFTTPYTDYETRIVLQTGIVIAYLLMMVGFMVGYALLQIRQFSVATRSWKSENLWLYVPLAVLLPLFIWVNHINLSRADFYYTQSRIFDNDKNWQTANVLLRQANSLNPHSFYELVIYNNLKKLAQQNNDQKEQLVQHTETLLKTMYEDNPYNLPQLFELGNFYLLQQSNLAQAIQYFEKAVVLAPTHIDNYLQVGAAYLLQKDYPAAIEQYQTALEIDDRCVKIWSALGEAYVKQGQAMEALQNHQQAIQQVDRCGDGFVLFSQHQPAFESYLQFYQQHEKSEVIIETLAQVANQSLDDYQQSLGYRPRLKLDIASRKAVVGYAYLINNEPEKALTFLEEAHQSDSPTERLSKALGETYLQLDQPDKAVDIYQQLISSNPTNLKLQREVAQQYQQYQQTDLAIELYQAVLETNPQDQATLVALAELYQAEQDWLNYLATSEQILAVIPVNEQANWFLTMTQAMLGGGESGISKFNDNLTQFLEYFIKQNQVLDFIQHVKTIAEAYPNNADVQGTIGHIYHVTDNTNLALPYLEKTLALDSNNFLALKDTAQIYMSQNQLMEAQPLFEQLVQQAPEDAELHMGLAYIYGHQKLYDQAIVHNRTVLDLIPDNYSALMNLMVIYQVQQDWPQALDMAKQAFQLAPTTEQPKIENFITQIEAQLQ